MKKMKWIAVAMGCILLLGCILTGCSANEPVESASPSPAASVEATPEPTPEPTPTPTPEPEYRKIGTEGEGAFTVLITNNVGKDITGLEIKSSEDEAYSENLVSEGEVIAQGETVELYYMPEKAEDEAKETGEVSEETNEPEVETASGEANAEDVLFNISYDVRLTCADESVIDLYDFGFGDMDEAELCFDEESEVGYVTYISTETGETVNTKEAQVARKVQEEEEASESREDASGSSAKSEPAPQPVSEPAPQPDPAPQADTAPEQSVDDCLEENILWND